MGDLGPFSKVLLEILELVRERGELDGFRPKISLPGCDEWLSWPSPRRVVFSGWAFHGVIVCLVDFGACCIDLAMLHTTISAL
jgi:hypothetical protein